MASVGGRPAGDSRLPAAILALACVAVGVWVLLLGRGSSFWSDDWAFIVLRQGHSPSVFLHDFNGHFAAVPIAIYKLLLQVVGLSHHWPYRVAVLGLHVLGVALIWVYLRARVGAWLALAPALVLLVFGPAAELLVYPVNIGFQLAIVCGVGALLLLDRGPGPRLAAGACALLTIGIASSSAAFPFLVVVACSVLAPAARRSRWWVVAVPAGIYVLWTLGYGTGELRWSNGDIVWAYSLDGLARTAGALVAAGPDWGRPLALAAAALVCWSIARAPRLPLRVIGLALGLVTLWGLTALARAQLGVPGSERFLYPSAVLLALLLGETLAGRVLSRRLAPALAVLVAVVLYTNGTILHDQTLAIRDIGATVAGGVAAVVAEPDAIPAAFHPSVPVYGATAGQLRNAARLYGSPYPAPAQIAGASYLTRQSVDGTLRSATTPLVRPAPGATTGAAPPPATAAPGASVTTRGGCLIVTPSAGGAGLADVELPAAGLLVRAGSAPVEVRTRRYSPVFGAADVAVPAGASNRLVALPAGAPPAWRGRFSAAAQFSVCSLSG